MRYLSDKLLGYVDAGAGVGGKDKVVGIGEHWVGPSKQHP